MIRYNAPPVIGHFMRSNSFGRLLAGPVGSGKTYALIHEVLRRSIEQEPSKDGTRYTRWVIVRYTLEELKKTVLQDCQAILDPIGQFKVMESKYELRFGDVHSDIYLLPFENEKDQRRVLSMQLTGAWLSECIELDIGVLGPVSERLGRYPSAERGVPSWFGMIADTNMPALGSPWHRFMTEPPMDWSIFKQPGGLSDDAENLEHLVQTADTAALDIWDKDPDKRRLNIALRRAQGRKYYERLLELHGTNSDRAKRYIHAEYGDDPSGTAVYRDSFRRSFHVVPNTYLVPTFPIIIGQDFGRDPWSLICQADHRGRLVVHEEVPAEGTGLEQHVLYNLKPRLMQPQYAGYKIGVVGDPSGASKSTITEESNFDALRRMGLPGFPAPTNDLDPRIRAVEALLLRQTDGAGSLLINEAKCPQLVRAMDGGYRYGKTKDGARKPVPDKTGHYAKYSHVADCLQYAALAVHGGMVDYISTRLNPIKKKQRPTVSAKAWT